MYERGLPVSKHTIFSLLQGCSKRKDLAAGRQVHCLMVSSGLDSVNTLVDHLIRLFTLCGSLLEANLAFCQVARPSIYTWHAIISAHVFHGESDRALELFCRMQEEGIRPNKFIFLCVLKATGIIGSLQHCKVIHDQITRDRLESDLEVGSTLVDTYVKCGSLEEACKVFDRLPTRDIVSWAAIIGGYAQYGQGLHALELFERMQLENVEPDKVTFLCILKACGSVAALRQGKLVHDQIIKSGLESDLVLRNCLIDMYSKCGCLVDSHTVFDEQQDRNVVSWGAVIDGYAQYGHGFSALELFGMLQQEGIKPNEVIFPSVLKACGSLGSLPQGKLIHDQIIRNGLETDVIVGSTLIDMYATCGSLEEARKVFNNLPNRNVVSWNVMIAGYVQHGDAFPALELFVMMKQEGIKPKAGTLLCILKACGTVKALDWGRFVHDQIIKNQLESDVVVGSTLVDMYAKCGRLEEAQAVFNEMPNRNAVSWGAMIAGYAQHGHGLFSLELFAMMLKEGVKPDQVTFLCTLKACVSTGVIEQGKLVHNEIITSGLEADVVVGNTLINMYAKCESLAEANKVFDNLLNRDVVSWDVMITGYTRHGRGHSALKLFEKMQQEGVKPDKVTILCLLKACGTLRQGKLLHDHIMSMGLQSDMAIGSTLIDMYAKCGNLEPARQVFDMLQTRDVVSWGAMIGAYARHGHGLAALQLFEEMKLEGTKPNEVTFFCILKACGSIGALGQGDLMHEEIIRCGLESDTLVGSALVEMYAKCGNLEEACGVFDGLLDPDVTSWGAMIAGYAQHGECRLVRQCLESMKVQGLKPHSTIYTNILSACGHAGDVEEGQKYFMSMREDHAITPSIEQFNCMVDLLGHAGCLQEAEQLLQTMPASPDIIGWMALLSACRTYSNVELGRRCFDQVMQLDPNVAAGYMLMSKIYADASMWHDFHEIQDLKVSAIAWKNPGRAWIEVSNNVHQFFVGDTTHPQNVEIYDNLKRVIREMKNKGYIPHWDLVFEPVSNEEDGMSGYFDEFTSAPGLLKTPEGVTASVTKSPPICSERHNSHHITYMLEWQKVRSDALQVNFEDGVYSCGIQY